ncbi:MAG TPA: carbohydrate ABC transporter permease [Gaiellaceae bacterium]
MTSRTERIANYTLLTLFSLIALYPIVAVLMVALHNPNDALTGLSVPTHPDFHNFTRAWSTAHFSQYFKSSVIVSGSVVVLATVCSILAGYAFGTFRFRGSSALFYILLLGLVLPMEVAIIPLYYDFRRFDLVNSYIGLILPQVGLSVAFGTFWMRAFFRSTPRSLVEAARIDGASTFSILWRVLLPTGRPAVLTMVVLVFMWTWNEFLLPLVLVSDESHQTAPLGLAFFQYRHITDLTGISAAALIIAAPTMLVYVFLQRRFIAGMISGAIKG